jgi:hypothetical protein
MYQNLIEQYYKLLEGGKKWKRTKKRAFVPKIMMLIE